MSFEQWMHFLLHHFYYSFAKFFFLLLISFIWIFPTVKSHSQNEDKWIFTISTWFFILTHRKRRKCLDSMDAPMQWDSTIRLMAKSYYTRRDIQFTKLILLYGFIFCMLCVVKPSQTLKCARRKAYEKSVYIQCENKSGFNRKNFFSFVLDSI